MKRALALMMLGSLSMMNAAYADIIELESKIIDVDSSMPSGYLKVYRLDPQTNKTEEIRVNIDDSTLFRETDSIRDLKAGDEVSIQADFNAHSHEWKAQSITLKKIGAEGEAL